MVIKYDLVADFARPSKTNTIVISQHDKGTRMCEFTLMADRKDFDMSDVNNINILGITSNGHRIIEDATAYIVTDDEGNYTNKIQYSLPEEVTRYAGTTVITLTVVSKSGDVITSFETYITVRDALYDVDSEISAEEEKNFKALYNEIQAALAILKENVKNEALPNPEVLRIIADGMEPIEYKGDVARQVDIGSVIHLVDSEELDESIDETSAKIATEAANEARGYAASAQANADIIQNVSFLANEAYDKAVEATDLLNNIDETIPTASVVKEDNKATITITDRNGTTSVDIYDGAGGSEGGGSGVSDYNQLRNLPFINGSELKGGATNGIRVAAETHSHLVSDITDLVLPTITVGNKVNGVTRLTIKDNTGTKYADISDGAKGENTTWHRGTGVTGDSYDPVVMPNDDSVDPKNGDFYLNSSTGTIYHCVVENNVVKWAKDFTMTGGGSGGSEGGLSNVYINNTQVVEGNNSADYLRLAVKDHKHTIADVDSLSDALDAKMDTLTEGETRDLAYYGISESVVTDIVTVQTESLPKTVNNKDIDIQVTVGSQKTSYTYNAANGSQAGTLTVPINIPAKASRYQNTDTSGYLTGSVIANEFANYPKLASTSATAGQFLKYGDSGWAAETVNIPSKTSDITNDSGFITESALGVVLTSDSVGANGATYVDITLPEGVTTAGKLVDVYYEHESSTDTSSINYALSESNGTLKIDFFNKLVSATTFKVWIH